MHRVVVVHVQLHVLRFNMTITFDLFCIQINLFNINLNYLCVLSLALKLCIKIMHIMQEGILDWFQLT